MNKPKKLRPNSPVIRTFLRISSIFFIILLIISVFVYSNFQKILIDELMANNYNNAENYILQTEDLLQSCSKVVSVLSMSPMVQYYISAIPTSTELFEGFYERIQEQLSTYTLSFSYINSIYIYSPKQQNFIRSTNSSATSSQPENILSLTDRSWIESLSQIGSEIHLSIRAINNLYPFVITLIKRVEVDDQVGYIILNIDLKKIPALLGTNQTELGNTYILTNDGSILYRKGKRALLEESALVPELSQFDPNRPVSSVLVENTSRPYIYTQIKSEVYDWHYVSISYLQDYTRKLSHLRSILVYFLGSLAALFLVIAFLLSFAQHRPLRKILSLLENPKKWIESSKKYTDEVQQIVGYIISYIQQNNTLSSELRKQLQILNDTRVWALQSQINPHFIFNTLNQIHLMAAQKMGFTNPVSKMIIQFGKLMRYALESDNLVTVEKEAEQTALFVSILAERYKNKVQIDFDLQPNTHRALVPKLILQPLIENAIYHGIGSNLDRGLLIQISSQIEKRYTESGICDYIIIHVRDNGLGIPAEILEGIRTSLNQTDGPGNRHIGLYNIATRLRLLYPGQSNLKIDSTVNHGTVITLSFPCKET